MTAGLQLVGTDQGVAITGPGGSIVLNMETQAMLADFSVSLLDVLEPDPDSEPNGDEQDGNRSEDDFMHHGLNWLREPGCPVSDPGGCEHDGREEDQE